MPAEPSSAATNRLRILIIATVLALPASAGLAAPPPAPTQPAPPAAPPQPAPPAPPAAQPTPPASPSQPAQPAAPALAVQPLPTYPDISSDYSTLSLQKTVRQTFAGRLKRHGRKIYFEEQSSSSGPVGYNEYFIFDLDKNVLYRLLRDEQVYFEFPLTIEQRVEAIRKGWVPAAGIFSFNNINVTLSSKDIPLRPDIVDKRPVELNLREVTSEIPAIGTAPAHSVKYYSFVWLDPALQLPVKISFSTHATHMIVEYHNMAEGAVDPSLFEIPKDYVDLTPY